MRRSSCLSLLLVLAAGPACGQTPLAWKFQEGDKFYLEETSVLKLSVKVEGEKAEKQELKTTLLSTIKVLKTNPDGSVVLEQTLESFTAKNLDGSPVENPVNDRMKGAVFRMTFDKAMAVIKFEGYDDLVRKVAGGDAQREKAFRAEMSEDEARRRLSEPFNLYLPAKEIKKGDRWTRDRNVTAAPLGTLAMKLQMTAAGEATLDGRPMEKLALTAEAKLSPPKPDSDAAVQVVDVKLKLEGIQGEVLFDAKAGRLGRLDLKVPMDGTFTLAIQGNKVEAQMSGEIRQTIRVLEKLPAAD